MSFECKLYSALAGSVTKYAPSKKRDMASVHTIGGRKVNFSITRNRTPEMIVSISKRPFHISAGMFFFFKYQLIIPAKMHINLKQMLREKNISEKLLLMPTPMSIL